jgi:SPP1 gp7 family putative phage head morphogenesis protein
MIPKKNTAKDLWEPKRRIEINYQRNMRKIMKQLEKKLKGLNSLSSILRVLKEYSKSEEFQKYAEAAAKKMVTGLFSDAGKTWRTAANVNSKGRHIYEALKNEIDTTPIGISIKEQTERNARLITGIPRKVSEEITDYVSKRAIEGRRSEDIAEELHSIYPKMLKNKVDLIARTETSKTSSALTQSRSENLGLKWYVWRTSEDARVRKSHDHMDGVLINWDNPPSPEQLVNIKSTLGRYHAGCAPNCRCYSEVVIRLDFVKFPCKVFYNNQIVRMTRKQFESIM